MTDTMGENKKNNDTKAMMDEEQNMPQEEVVQDSEDTLEDTGSPEGGNAELDLEAAIEAANDKYIRLYAEFDNYKRRTAKERVTLIQSAGKDVISSLLPILDDFDRALKAMEQTTNIDSIREGILLVSQKMKKTLAQQGLKEMESIGKPFDAELQEAITSIPAPSDDMKGNVVDEIEKGYFLNDLVLRHAKVVVGN